MVDVVDELRDALLDMIWQFCSKGDKLSHSFMSAEEMRVMARSKGLKMKDACASAGMAYGTFWRWKKGKTENPQMLKFQRLYEYIVNYKPVKKVRK